MKLDQFGNPIFSTDEATTALLSGQSIDGAILEDEEEAALYSLASEILDLKTRSIPLNVSQETVEEFHDRKSNEWVFPKEYRSLDVKALLLDKCVSQTEVDRVEQEYKMFQDRGLVPLLQLMAYLVDYMREQGLVWGVGRGSSVASYCLYLLGVHKVNSLKYDLPIEEFLR